MSVKGNRLMSSFKKRLSYFLPFQIKDFLRAYFLEDRTIGRKFPRRIQLETTSICPTKCIMCIGHTLERKNKFMEDSLIDKIIKECSHYEVNMQLLFYGDPLTDKRLPAIIRKCKDKNLLATITTSGVLLTPELSQEILNAGLDYCGFSVDGNTKGTYEKIRFGADFERAIKNIESFIELRNKGNYKTAIDVRMVGMKINRHEWDGFIKRWTPIVDGARIEKFGRKGAEYDKQEEITPRNKKDCEVFFNELCITTDGEATICCRDGGQNIVGNVAKDGIKKVWLGTERRRIADIMKKEGSFGIPYCRDCNL